MFAFQWMHVQHVAKKKRVHNMGLHWPLSAVIGLHQLLLAVIGLCWLSLAVVGHHWVVFVCGGDGASGVGVCCGGGQCRVGWKKENIPGVQDTMHLKPLPLLLLLFWWLLRPGPNGSELPKMSPEWAGTWPQLMCCASVLSLSLICRETKERV